MAYETIQTPVEAGKVGVVTLHRPNQLNALNDQLLGQLAAELEAFDRQEAIGCLVLAGSDKAFAAGGDIGDMAKFGFADVYKSEHLDRHWQAICGVRSR